MRRWRFDPGGVADQIPGNVDSSATAAAVGKSGAFVIPVVSRFARDHRLPYETPAGVEVHAALRSTLMRRVDCYVIDAFDHSRRMADGNEK
jgi:hypothetical protein